MEVYYILYANLNKEFLPGRGWNLEKWVERTGEIQYKEYDVNLLRLKNLAMLIIFDAYEGTEEATSIINETVANCPDLKILYYHSFPQSMSHELTSSDYKQETNPLILRNMRLCDFDEYYMWRHPLEDLPVYGAWFFNYYSKMIADIVHKLKYPIKAIKIFISYVREDYEQVIQIADFLSKKGADVWWDKRKLLPGQDWEDEIRNAIENGNFFIACFSEAYNRRLETYMNEELAVAIKRLRKMTKAGWFIPILLNNCEMPDIDVRPGKTIRSYQALQLFENWNEELAALGSLIETQNAVTRR